MLQSIFARITVSPVLVQLLQQVLALTTPAAPVHPLQPAARPQRVSRKVQA